MMRTVLFTPPMLVLALLVSANSQTPQLSGASSSGTVRQTPGAITTLRSIKVNAQTITALPSGRKYVVDLTQRGVVYEFNSQSSQIDFSRIVVRTTKGEVAIGSFLKAGFLKAKLANFKYTAQAFSLRTRPAGTLQNRPTTTSLISCDWAYEICTCTGEDECDELIWDRACGDIRFCATNPITNQIVCSCVLTKKA